MNVRSLITSKWGRRGLVAVIVLLGLWVLLWAIVPPLAKGQIEKAASQFLGRTVTLERVDFRPWSLEVALEGLRIEGASGAEPLLEVRRIYADAELQSLLRFAPVIDALRMEAPVVRVARTGDGRYDIDDILERLAQAPSEPEPQPKEIARFALYNIAVSQGAAYFDDQPAGRKHELRDFQLTVPFVSSLKSQREVQVAPHLAFVLNGSPFDSSAASTPFVDSRHTNAQIAFSQFDLKPYLGYVPKSLPVQLTAGTLGAKLQLGFEQGAQAVLRVSGEVRAEGVEALDQQGRELLRFDSLQLALADVQPLARQVHLSSVALVRPQAIVARDESGRLNLMPAEQAAPGVPAAPPAPEAAAPAAAEKNVWQTKVDRITVSDGQIGWRDAQVQAKASVDVNALHLDVQALRWPMDDAARLTGRFELDGATVEIEGQGTDREATLRAQVQALPLSIASAYLSETLEPTVAGKVDASLEATWKAPDLTLVAQKASVEELALTQGKTALASVGRFELADVHVDLKARDLRIGQLSVRNPKIRVERDAEKRWMYERWLRTPVGAAPARTAAASAANAPNAPAPWKLRLDDVTLENGALAYVDRAKTGAPVDVEVTALNIQAGPIVPASAVPAALAVSGRLAAGGRRNGEVGRFNYQGKVTLEPVATNGQLQMQAIPAHLFKAYYSDDLNVDIRRAYSNFKGQVAFAMPSEGMRLKVSGDSALEDFRANSAALTQSAAQGERSEQLLSWKALSLRGLNVDMTPAQPLKVEVRETTLTDLFARVIVEESGRLNLQNLSKSAQAEAQVSAAAESVTTSERKRGGTTVTTRVPAAAGAAAGESQDGAPATAEAKDAPAASAAPPANPPANPLAPIIRFGPVNVVNGKVDFTDLFIKPNYSADLSELNGRLSAFSSTPRDGETVLADLELRGKAQQTAALEITGKLNPLASPLELDITARMRDLDLPPLSPYSVRYAGHGIERGKLSMDVNYQVAADGRLTATNKLVLNQLRFGDEIKDAPNSLPVRLAVALLADRNGVIDVDLPLSGSLNDPQFSVGPLIWKAVLNLITKAVTAPFSLLTGGLGAGAGDANAIAFSPGDSMLTDDAKKALDQVAKALIDRPELRLTVVGMANLEKEKQAYQRQRVRQMAMAEKRRVAARKGQDGAVVPPVSDAEYPELLEAVYKRADLPSKPRNAIGIARSVSVEEMERLLFASISVDAQVIRELAVARAAAVRDYLLEKQLPSERLFLGDVKLDAAGADWRPGTHLELDTR